MTEVLCTICDQDKAWHDANKPVHPFSPPGGVGGPGKLNEKKKSPEVKVAGVQGDPVLRIALVRAGVIRYEDLVMIEEELSAARQAGGVVFADPRPQGNEGTADAVGGGSGVPLGARGDVEDPRPGDRRST